MMKAFNVAIKPLNEQLGKDLGISKINVKYEGTEHKVPVTISYCSYEGNRVTRKAGTQNFYRALGLMI